MQQTASLHRDAINKVTNPISNLIATGLQFEELPESFHLPSAMGLDYANCAGMVANHALDAIVC